MNNKLPKKGGTVTDDIFNKAVRAAVSSTTRAYNDADDDAQRHAARDALHAIRAYNDAVASASTSNFESYYAFCASIRSADDKEAAQQMIIKKLKQILDTGEFKED